MNINSITNVFELLKEQIKGNIDILVISEIKIDHTFPHSQFLINGFSTPCRLNRDSNGGGILLYVGEDVPSSLIAIENKPIISYFVELNLHNNKWLINNYSHNPHKSLISNHLDALSIHLHLYYGTYKRVIILGDFNADIGEWHMKCFWDINNLKGLIKQATCYTLTVQHDLLTNASRSLDSTCVLLETGLSDFLLMNLIVMRKKLQFQEVTI